MVLLGKYIPNALNNADPDPAFPPNVREGRNVGRKRGRKTWSVFIKDVNIMKDKERLKNCSKLKEIKEN